MSESRKIEMKDGRIVEFGERQKIDKVYGSTADGKVFVQLDFDNGETIRLEIDPASAIGHQACGHGLSQKLGDSAAGAESTSDAFESVLEVASRISKGEWLKGATGATGGSAKGASELVEAMVIVIGQSKDVVREMLSQLKQADKMALRKTPAVAAVIEKLRADKGPSKAEQEKAAKGANLLEALARGEVPVSDSDEE